MTESTKFSLKNRLEIPGEERPFLILLELPPCSGQDVEELSAFLEDVREKKSGLPEADDVALAGVTLPQSPRGIASLSPADVFTLLNAKKLWEELDVVPHVSTKDTNVQGLRTYLLGLRALGLASVLVVTGDVPSESLGVFEVDSLGILDIVREMNFKSFQRAKIGQFEGIHQFFPLAAVSPFKYTEASQMQQYLKMKKKIRGGAGALITQMGWDSRKSEELFRYLREEGIEIPVFSNVYLLSSTNAVPRLMYGGQFPGCLLTEDLYKRVSQESFEAHLERAAQQVAMYRDLGAAGVDLGGFPDFASLLAVIQKAREIGGAWRDFRKNLDFGVRSRPDGSPPFYLYDSRGERKNVSRPRPPLHKRTFDFFHASCLTPGRGLFPVLKKTLSLSRSLRKGEGLPYKLALAAEKAFKTLFFDCAACGDCYLVENFGYCTVGLCKKGLPNPPCGDATPEGRCGNDEERICVGEPIYRAAASEGEKGLVRLEEIVNAPRDAALLDTASIVNFLFGKDHTRSPGLILIGETLHASIPRTRAAMQFLFDRGEGAFEIPSGALAYLVGLIDVQVRRGADFIDVNVDAFGEEDLRPRIGMMCEIVRLIRRHGRGVPVCIDSGSPEVLEAGLDEWYRGAPLSLAAPLLNSVKKGTMDRIFPLRRKKAFAFIGLLLDDRASNWAEVCSADDQHDIARYLVQEAKGNYGFAAGEIYLDATVFPLAVDMPMAAGRPGYTYRTFQTLEKIRKDPDLKGVHCVLGISNSVKELPGRATGVTRAYLARAQERGLDAAIVNVLHGYGLRPPAPDLLEFVDAFSGQDGSADASQAAIDAMMRFCQATRRAGRTGKG